MLNNKDLKVKPGEKKVESDRDKAAQFLRDHPEIIHNARDLFHNENGKTVIEAAVPRGDLSVEESVMPRTQYDLKEADYKDILAHTKKIIDPVMKQYDERVAMEDALTVAIATLDDGKYANRVNANTYNLLMDKLVK
jgi:hypothetical protein